MSLESPRLPQPGLNLQPDHLGRHRGRYPDLVRRIRRWAKKQTPRGRAGIREDAANFLRWISDERTLRVAWDYLARQGGQAPGIDGWRYRDIPDAEVWRWLRDVRSAIRTGEYRPAPDRVVEIPKGPGRGTRRLAIPCILDRAVQRAAVEVLQPYLDPLFTRLSFGFRPGRGAIDAVAHACHYFQTEGRRVWVTADVRDAFARVPIGRLRDVLRYYLGADDVTEFICRALGGAATPGLRQGGPLSPLCLSLYLHHHLDVPWAQRYPETRLLRYADDVLLMCRTAAEARAAHDQLVELLRPAGMLLRGDRSSDVATLTPACPARWLGYQFEAKGRKTLRVFVAEPAWDALACSLADAHDAPDSPLRAWQTIRAWIASLGPCYEHADVHETSVRIAATAGAAGFDEIPDETTVAAWWQRAHARWRRTLQRVAAGNDS